jgi:hypothetical protein
MYQLVRGITEDSTDDRNKSSSGEKIPAIVSLLSSNQTDAPAILHQPQRSTMPTTWAMELFSDISPLAYLLN